MSAIRKAIQYLGFDVAENEENEYYDDELAPVTNLHDVSEVRKGRHAPAAAPASRMTSVVFRPSSLAATTTRASSARRSAPACR